MDAHSVGISSWVRNDDHHMEIIPSSNSSHTPGRLIIYAILPTLATLCGARKQTNTQTHKQTNKHTNKQTHNQTNTQTNKQANLLKHS